MSESLTDMKLYLRPNREDFVHVSEHSPLSFSLIFLSKFTHHHSSGFLFSSTQHLGLSFPALLPLRLLLPSRQLDQETHR